MAAGGARAQSVRIGLFASDNPVMGPASDAFLDELRKEGFIDGQNLVVERKSTAQGSEALVAQALEMARANLDVLVALGSETTLQACARATRSIPIVFVANNYDPIARGYVEQSRETRWQCHQACFYARLSLRKNRSILDRGPSGSNSLGGGVESISAGSVRCGGEAREAAAARSSFAKNGKSTHDIAEAFRSIGVSGADMLLVLSSQFLARHRDQLTQHAIDERIPGMFIFKSYVEAGAYCHTAWTTWRCTVMAQLLWPGFSGGAEGVRPTVQQPTKYEMAVDLRTTDNWRRVPNLDPPARRRGDRMRWRERDFKNEAPQAAVSKTLRLRKPWA